MPDSRLGKTQLSTGGKPSAAEGISALAGTWYLEPLGALHANPIPITKFPFRAGRRPGLELQLASRSVSSEHAEIYIETVSEVLRIRDLKSTNGTYVNRGQITDVPLQEGDVIHFADVEFRIRSGQSIDFGSHTDASGTSRQGHPARKQAHNNSEILELMETEAFVPVFQPIVMLPDGDVFGYEALTRGRHPNLPESPAELLRIAAGLGMESRLSEMFRRKALNTIGHRRDFDALFLNTNPQENDQDLIHSAQEMRKIVPHLRIVLEIHERSLAEVSGIRHLQDQLASHGIQLAFDDFGAGEARLVQLSEVPPDYLKFDICFIQGIDKAPESKRRLLSSLVAGASELGVQPIAEGIETRGEAETCSRIGFKLAQGYYFGRPLEATKL